MRDRPETPPWRALNAALTDASAKAPRSAISSAKARVAAFSSVVRHHLVDQPDRQRLARAMILGLRNQISLACFLPTRSSRYQVP